MKSSASRPPAASPTASPATELPVARSVPAHVPVSASEQTRAQHPVPSTATATATAGVHRAGALFAALACVLVGVSFTAGGALVDYPHAAGQALRYGAACLLLIPLARGGAVRRLRALTVRQWARAAAVAAVGMVGFNLSVLAAERTAEPAVPGVLVGCAPVVVAVVLPLLAGRRPSPAVVAGALLVASGAFVVQGWGGTDGAGLAWSVAALGGEVGFALLAAPLVAPLGPPLLSACVSGLAAAEAALLAVAGDGFRMPTGPQALALGWQAVLATVIGFVCWYAGMQRLGAERATLFSGLIPVSAALTAPVAGVGTLGAGQLAGSALVACGVALGANFLHRRRAARGPGVPAGAPAVGRACGTVPVVEAPRPPDPPAGRDQGEPDRRPASGGNVPRAGWNPPVRPGTPLDGREFS